MEEKKEEMVIVTEQGSYEQDDLEHLTVRPIEEKK